MTSTLAAGAEVRDAAAQKARAPYGPWVALCDGPQGAEGRAYYSPWPLPELLVAGTAMIEVALDGPPKATLGLIDYQSARGWPREVSLTLSPGGHVALRHRQGGRVAEAGLNLPMSPDLRGLRLTYCWNAPQRRSVLVAQTLPDGAIRSVAARDPLPLPDDDASAIFGMAMAGVAQAPLSWMGLALSEVWPGLGAAVCGATPVLTPDGPVRADALRPGDLVTTRDHGPQPLRWVGAGALPSRGGSRAVRLCAPFYDSEHDVVVAPDQLVALTGAETEHVFGNNAAFVAARNLVDDRTAILETRRPTVDCRAFLFDRPEVIFAGALPLTAMHLDAGTAPGLPGTPRPVPQDSSRIVLRGFEAITLRETVALSRNPAVA